MYATYTSCMINSSHCIDVFSKFLVSLTGETEVFLVLITLVKSNKTQKGFL